MKPFVSVIIPTWNSEAYLAKCLHSLMAQTFRDFEIIVADKESHDRTQEIARAFGANVLVGGRERSEQCNMGAREAEGSLLWRTDSDCVFDPDLLSEAVAAFRKGADAIITNGAMDVEKGAWARVRDAERRAQAGDWAHTALSLYRREVFDAVGGFNEKLDAFEDYDLHNRVQRAGYKIRRINARSIHLGEPSGLAEVVKKYLDYGDRSNISEFSKQNPGKGMWQLAPFRLVYLRNIRKFGLLFFPFLVYHFVKYLSAFLGYLLS